MQPQQNDSIRKSQWTEGQVSLDPTVSNDSNKNTSQASAPQPAFTSSLPEKQDYAGDRVIVKYRSEPSPVFAETLSNQVIGTSSLAVPNAKLLKLAAGAEVPNVIQELLKDPNVLYAEPDYKVSPH